MLKHVLVFLAVWVAPARGQPNATAAANIACSNGQTDGKFITIARSPPESRCPSAGGGGASGDGEVGEGLEGTSPHFDRTCSGPLHPFLSLGAPEDEVDHGTIKIEGDLDTEYVASGLTITEDTIIYIGYDGIVAAEYTPECNASVG